MKKKTFPLVLAVIFMFSLAACSNQAKNSDSNGNTSSGAVENSKKDTKDTLSISAGSKGVQVKSGKADVDVNKKGTSVKTKDVKIKLGDKDKDGNK